MVKTLENAKTITTDVVIQATPEELWETLFTRFGETYLFNPNLDGSHWIKGNTGGIGSERHCDLDSKVNVQERITGAEELKQFTIEIIGGNMPIVKEMIVDIILDPVDRTHTRVSLVAHFTARPAIMAGMMKGAFKKKLHDMLVGLKYYTETGHQIEKAAYKPVLKAYRKLSLDAAFSR